MKTTALIATATLAAMLSACSGGKPGPEASSEAAEPLAASTAEPVQGEAAQAGIPEQLRGRWGLVPADCTSKKGDAKGLLTVSADQLTFYEAVAKLEAVKVRAPDMIAATFDFNGEGHSWVLDVALSSPDDGRTLVRKDTGPEAAPISLTYTRCP